MCSILGCIIRVEDNNFGKLFQNTIEVWMYELV